VNKEFEGKVALVTGAGSGIGAAVAIDLAKAGAAVVVSDISDELATRVTETITEMGCRAVKFVGDAANFDDVLASVILAKDTFGKLDLAFNNAGITGPSGDLADISIDEYRHLIDVNLNSVFFAMKAEIPEMIAAGGGAIVNTSSILGLVANPTSLSYTTAKHGINGMTKAAAVNYATRKIRINSVNPGYIDTPLLSKLPKETMDYLISLHPMGRLGTAEEVSQVVLFLLSDRASFVTGSQYVVDGGYTAI
jgi:NAD(P)-dependent dehydrogenase (short-subunit alcohol dehydrogenase family)